MAGQQRMLGGATGEAFESGEAVQRRKLADRVHPCVQVEGGKARSGASDLRHAQRDLRPDFGQRIGRHAKRLPFD
jgi:hypothetical protein